MKKIFMSAVCIMAITLFATPVIFAEAFNNDPAGTDDVTVEIPTSNVDLYQGTFTWDSSPNVSISGYTDAFAYCVMATHIQTDEEVGYEYATVASATGYAMQLKSVEQGENLGALSSTDLPSGDWEWVGGSGS